MNWFSRKVRAWRISNTLKADFCLEALTRPAEQDDPLRPRPVNMIEPRHELVKLTGLITWEVFGRDWSGFFPSATGLIQPPLVAGLLYLAYRLSDEAVVARWVENP
jgi:IS5 family transposase